MHVRQELIDRFFRYAAIESQSNGRVQSLPSSPGQAALAALLADADGAVCTRDRLVAEVWGRRWAGADRTLDVHVATLRTKLARPGMVATVRGVGYRLAAGGRTAAGLDGRSGS